MFAELLQLRIKYNEQIGKISEDELNLIYDKQDRLTKDLDSKIVDERLKKEEELSVALKKQGLSIPADKVKTFNVILEKLSKGYYSLDEAVECCNETIGNFSKSNDKIANSQKAANDQLK